MKPTTVGQLTFGNFKSSFVLQVWTADGPVRPRGTSPQFSMLYTNTTVISFRRRVIVWICCIQRFFFVLLGADGVVHGDEILSFLELDDLTWPHEGRMEIWVFGEPLHDANHSYLSTGVQNVQLRLLKLKRRQPLLKEPIDVDIPLQYELGGRQRWRVSEDLCSLCNDALKIPLNLRGLACLSVHPYDIGSSSIF